MTSSMRRTRTAGTALLVPLLISCGGGGGSGEAATPALRAAVERLPLTDREREIVTLLGAGLSSKAVADRLCLSVRTVEGHIYRAMAKTGAGSRAELVRLLPHRHD